MPALRHFVTRTAHAAASLLAACSLAQAAPPLPALNADTARITLSGISSGGFLAVQYQVAHSKEVAGSGVVAAGPYFCAQGSVVTATTACSCTADPLHQLCSVSATSAQVDKLVEATRAMAARGEIDPPSAIAQQRLYTLRGGADRTVPAPVVNQLDGYFAALGVPAANRRADTVANLGHGFPTQHFGVACVESAAPYLNRCGRDTAGDILAHLLGPLAPARTGRARGRLIEFDQRSYLPEDANRTFDWSTGLDATGWVYVPNACRASGARCKVHVALHGCRQGQHYLSLEGLPNGELYYGKTFMRRAGYDRWADTNRLIVLYPQAASIPALNPNGCWDWWGYSGEAYATRNGVQIHALHNMVSALSRAR